MDYNTELLVRTLKAAKLTLSDFARVMEVSRVTVYNWKNGGEPHALLVKRLMATLKAVISAQAAGDLPITKRTAGVRHELIMAAIDKHSGS